MFQFEQLSGFLYLADFLFLAATATIIIKLKLEKSSQGFSAKTQGVYGVVICTRNIDLLFVEGSTAYLVYSITKKIINISCIIYIVFKIKNTSKNTSTCNCNQDSFWVEALVLPCIIVTAVLHYGGSPEEVLWSFSTYLETVAMVPQFYLLHVRGKGDSYLPAYISLMAVYSFTDALAYSLNCFLYDKMPLVWPVCKCLQLGIYIWYFFIPREPVLPVANCDQRKRRATVFMKQQSMLAQTLLKKNTSANDLQLSITSSRTSASNSICSSSDGFSLEGGQESVGGESPPPTPCIKFDVGFEDEVINLKAPIITTIRQLKNKGTLKLKSLPGSPESTRKLSTSSSSPCFKPINEFTQFDTAKSQRAKRMKNLGLSLPTTPEAVRKSELTLKYPCMTRSISQCNSIQLKRERAQLRLEMSLPNTPETKRRNELILTPNSLSPNRTLNYLPLPQQHKYRPKRPPLPTVEGSPAFIKKTDQTTTPISPLVIGGAPSPKPERPPPPKTTFRTDPENENNHSNDAQPDTLKEETTNTHLDNNTVFIVQTDSKRCKKPKRPPLPKLIISTASCI